MARKLFWALVSSNNLTLWGWRIPFGPDDFPGQIEFDESPPNYFFLTTLQTGQTYFCPLPYQQQLTIKRIEPSGLWTLWVYTSRSKVSTVEHELDELIPPLTIQQLHSWTTFKETATRTTHLRLNILKSATQYLSCLQRRIFRFDI